LNNIEYIIDGRSKKIFSIVKILKIFNIITFCKIFLNNIEYIIDGRSKKYFQNIKVLEWNKF